jgi:hypothetical protein
VFRLISILLLAAAPKPADSVAGLYQSRQMEVGAALELEKNGHYRYQLDYGAVSESASGTWTFDGKDVRLTSAPLPRQPDFVLVEDRPAPKCEISISVDWSKVDWSTAPRVLLTYADDPKAYLVEADESGKLESTRCNATTIRPLVPIYEAIGSEVKLTPGQGHKLAFRFEPNDLGQAAFRNEPLMIDGQDLVLKRYDTDIRFIRVRH